MSLAKVVSSLTNEERAKLDRSLVQQAQNEVSNEIQSLNSSLALYRRSTSTCHKIAERIAKLEQRLIDLEKMYLMLSTSSFERGNTSDMAIDSGV